VRERGNIYVYLAIGIAVLGIITALFFGYKGQLADADQKGYERGKQETDAAYKGRDNKQLQTVIAERDRLIKEAQAREDQHNLEIGQQEEAHAAANASQDARYNALLAKYRGLPRQPSATGTCPPSGDQGRPGATAADTGGSARPVTRGELLGADGEFLIREARRADARLSALRLCRETLIIERK